MKKIAITGSAGFIGKNLVRTLKEKGYDVFQIDLINGIDLTDAAQLTKIPRFDVIFHLAAKSFVPDSFKYPDTFFRTNFLSTLHVLEMARQYHAKVIFLSSYLYGSPQYLPIDEKHPLEPHNPYAQSKLICENLCESYYRDLKVPVMVFRPFNIYGPGQNEAFLIPSIVKQLNQDSIILKDPRPKRDFIYIDDVINALIKGLDYQMNDFQIFNLGSGISTSIEELIKLVLSLSKNKPSLSFTNEYRHGEVLNTIADISKINKLLNWKPTYNIESGLNQILNFKDAN